MSRNSKRRGFTLVELVVVVLVLGIVAAVAAPRMFDTSQDARESSTKASLGALRNAVGLYKAKYTTAISTTEATFKLQLEQILQGSFPQAEVGNVNANVRIVTTGNELTASGTQGWAYNSNTDKWIVNHSSYETW